MFTMKSDNRVEFSEESMINLLDFVPSNCINFDYETTKVGYGVIIMDICGDETISATELEEFLENNLDEEFVYGVEVNWFMDNDIYVARAIIVLNHALSNDIIAYNY